MSKLLFIISIFFICGIANNVLAARALPIKTGQTTVYRSGDDATYQDGMKWDGVGLRFIANSVSGSEVTIKDRLTGLIWSKNANIAGQKNWTAAISYCENLVYAGHSDWTLPNILELKSLLDYSKSYPVLPSGHPFSGVGSSYYWSSSTAADNSGIASSVHFNYGSTGYSGKGSIWLVWPVRTAH